MGSISIGVLRRHTAILAALCRMGSTCEVLEAIALLLGPCCRMDVATGTSMAPGKLYRLSLKLWRGSYEQRG